MEEDGLFVLRTNREIRPIKHSEVCVAAKCKRTKTKTTKKRATKVLVRRRRVGKPTASLTDFIRAEKQKGCPVCALPPDIQAQLRQAPEKKIKIVDRVRWLKEVVRADVTTGDLTRHNAARHDDA